jgi:hypothetical protein
MPAVRPYVSNLICSTALCKSSMAFPTLARQPDSQGLGETRRISQEAMDKGLVGPA